MSDHLGHLIIVQGAHRLVCTPCVVALSWEDRGPRIWHGNVFPYQGRCTVCGRLVVHPLTPAWPDLYPPTDTRALPIEDTDPLILERKRRTDHTDYALIDRGPAPGRARWVVGTITADSWSAREWFWGHYFERLEDAEAYYRDVCGEG